MKVTGTKKLLIILCALMCALTAGIGVMFARSAFNSGAGVAYAQEEVPPAGEEEETTSEEEVAFSDAENEAEEEEEVEKAYDPRFDEGVIAEIARLAEMDADFINLYCHVRDIDANDLLEAIVDGQEKLRLNPKSDIGYMITNPDGEVEESSGIPDEDDENILFDIYGDMNAFANEYIQGETQISEDDDWYVAPDDVGVYATYRYMGYNNGTFTSYNPYRYYTSTNGGASWTDITSTIAGPLLASTYFNPLPTPSFEGHVWTDANGTHKIWDYCGQRVVVDLAPGEIFRVQCNRTASSSTYFIDGASYGDTTHWWSEMSQNFGWNKGNSYFTVDGDAPTGQEMKVYNSFPGTTNTVNNGTYNGCQCFFTFANSTVAWTSQNSVSSVYAQQSSKFLYKVFVIRRSNPAKPQIVDDGSGGVDVGAGTKSVYFEGEPVTISMTPDFGAGMLEYAFFQNEQCTIPDDTVTLSLRSMHGREGTAGAKITFRSSVAGKHYIQLRLIQPAASPHLPSTAMSWAEGGNAPVRFLLEIKMQRTAWPTVVADSYVATNGKSKTVNYTGEEHTVTFTHCDKSLLSWSSNGMIEESWTDADGGTLTLKQTERGTYKINIYITNTAGCTWEGTTPASTMYQFDFYIKEMKIDRTLNLADPSVFTLHEGYTGTEHILEVGPAKPGQLVVVAPGVNFSYLEKEVDGNTLSYIKFSMVDSTSEDGQPIEIRPAKGYMWSTGTAQETIKFVIIIDAVAIPFPELLLEDGLVPGKDYTEMKNGKYTTKNLVFNPAYGWKGTLVIKNIPKQAISTIGLNTAMEVLSWVPSDEWYAKEENKGKQPLDIDCTVLTLGATNANTYPVIISITDPNFTWEIPTDPPVFNLFIDRYELYAPMIAGDTRELVKDIVRDPALVNEPYASFVEPDFTTVYADGQKKIDGQTKQVYYNTNPAAGDYTPNTDKYFRLYAGGFTSNNQVTIEYSKSGLTPTFPYSSDGIPLLNLQGLNAGNYIINITPTSNYRWVDGSTSMRTFKFNIIPIIRDSLEMFKQTTDGNSWEPIDTFDGGVTFDGEQHKFRIGNYTNPSQNYDATQMTYALVDQAYNVISPSSYPDGFTIGSKTVEGVTILEGTAVHAGVYIIRLKLNNENYSWRQGQGIDMYYTFRVTAKTIKNPMLMADECNNGAGQNVIVVDEDSNHFVYGGYNGNNFQMVIGFTLDGLLPEELDIDYNPSGIDFDPENGDPAFWGRFNANVDEVGLTRLITNAKIVGDHKLTIQLRNKDYKWASDEKYYEFLLIIAEAEVAYVEFEYSDTDGGSPIAVYPNGDGCSVTYDPDPDKMHTITVRRSDNEFDATSFESMFTYNITYTKSDYEVKKEAYNFDNLVLGFKDANTYVIDIFLTANYKWKGTNGNNNIPARFTLLINPKQVSVPLIIDEGEVDESGKSIADINQSTKTKVVTYDTNTLQSIAINLGNDFRAYEVDDTQTTEFLNVDKNVNYLVDKKFRYTAKSAGTYTLAIKLIDTNNFYWAQGDVAKYTLTINPRPLDVPTAFFIHNKDLNDPHFDYLDIMTGKGEQIAYHSDTSKFDDVTKKYTGELQYIYLFGYAVENSEVNVSATPFNPDNAADLGHRDVSVGGDVKGHFIYAKYVNVYTITIEFKLSEEFNTPNCYWKSDAMGTDIFPRSITFEIEKKVVALPYLVADPLQTWEPDDAGYDSLTQKFTYDGANQGPAIEIANCLEKSPTSDATFMTYGRVLGLTDTRFYNPGNNVLTFFIINTAIVGTEYKLVISLDTANECWDTLTTDDIKDRHVYIVIEKKGITAPTMDVDTSDGAVYSTTVFADDTKTYEFDDTKNSWPSAMKVNGVDTDWMRYRNSESSTLMASTFNSGTVEVSLLDKNCRTYKLIVSLVDDVNLKWDGTTSSDPIEFLVTIAPKKYTRPVIDNLNYTVDTDAKNNGLVTINPEDFTTTYGYGSLQKFIILNYINDPTVMTVDISTGKKFEYGIDASENSINGTDRLTYGAESAGIYKVVIKPSLNATWATGDPGDITFTFTINKLEHKAPTIDTIIDEATPPLPSYYSDSNIDGVLDTKTVTYILDKFQSIIVNGYDGGTVMSIEYTGFNGDDNKTPISGSQVTYRAKNAGRYTVTIKIKEDLVANNCFDDSAKSDTLTFTFIIEKQKLAIPVFDNDSALLQYDLPKVNETVSASGDTFTVTYDGTRHADIVLNVLGEKYMTFIAELPAFNSSLAADRQFYYEDTPNSTKIPYGNSLNGIYRPSADNNMKPFLSALTLLSTVDKENYIRVDGIEPGTYKLSFSLANTDNFEWDDNTNTVKTVTFIINKLKVAAPEHVTPLNISKPYTGSEITFTIANVTGATGNGIEYTDGVTTAPKPSYIYADIKAEPADSGVGKEIKIVSLNTTTNVLTVSAVEIGTYTVTITIRDAEKDHVEWTPSGGPKTFTFTITPKAMQPKITYGDSGDATLDNQLATGGPYKWPKDVTVTATITFENISVLEVDDGKGGKKKVLDLDLSFEIYFINLAAAGKNINHKIPFTEGIKAELINAPQFITTPGPIALPYSTANSGDFHVELMPSGEYNLVYKYKLVPSGEGQLDMGSYRVHVVASSTESKSYTFNPNQANFSIEALKAPFDQTLIELELYYLSDPDNLLGKGRRFTLADVFPLEPTKLWTDMDEDHAIKLKYLENDDGYGFRFVLKKSAMYGPAPAGADLPDGKTTFDQTTNPAKTVLEALNRWQVKWTTNGTYVGKTAAKYAGKYNFSLTIAALDNLKYSYTTTTFTFYFEIEPVLYDLKDLDWNYVYGTDHLVYDGTAKTVELVGTFPKGLSVGSYVDPDYDRNSQIYFKYDPTDVSDNTTTNYRTLVTFVNSNPNYVTPEFGDPSTYNDSVRKAAGKAFPWVLIWGVEKQVIKDTWNDVLNNAGDASAYIPKLNTYGALVDYNYYLDDGIPTPVDSFDHTGYVDFLIEAVLKTNDDPALDYARNYDLQIISPDTNPHKFRLGPGAGTNIDVVIRDGDTVKQSTLSGGELDPLPKNNKFIYDGKPYSVTLKNFTSTVATTMDENNVVFTYYNVNNKFRPIAAPTDPGHYMVKLQLVNVPVDNNDYTLQYTEYYFDIDKGDFNPKDIYWYYTHTDSKGHVTEAKYDPTSKQWEITHCEDAFWNVNVWDCANSGTPGHIGTTTTFVYDGEVHEVKLVYGPSLDTPADNSLVIKMKSGDKYTNANVDKKYTAVASFSFNGKLWNEPDLSGTGIGMEMEWEIEKAIIDLTGLSWDIPTGGLMYTRVKGEEKGFNVLMKDIPDLLSSYYSYKFYQQGDEDKDSDGVKDYEYLKDANQLTLFTQVGNYRTEFIIKDSFAKENTNYELGTNPTLGLGGSYGLVASLNWSIDPRTITVPDADSSSWTQFDGTQHNLLSEYNIQLDWEEYYSIQVEYMAVGSSTWMPWKDYKEEAIAEFGSEYVAMHAGEYRLIFLLNSGINSDVQTNVQWRQNEAPFGTFTNDMVVEADNKVVYNATGNLKVAQAELTVQSWIDKEEATYVILETMSGLDSYTLNQYVDYVFFKSDGTTVTDSTTAYGINDVIKDPDKYAIMVYVLGTYKDKAPNFDINDFTNDVVVKPGATSVQGIYYHFEMTGSSTLDAPKRIPNLVYISGYTEAKDTGDFNYTFTYEDWQKMMAQQGIAVAQDGIKPTDEGYDWTEYLGPNPKDAEAYEKFTNPTAVDSTYDIENLIKIAEYKSKVVVDVVYGGFPITFHVNGWDGDGINYWDGTATETSQFDPEEDKIENVKYVDYLDKWQGEPNLTHNEVGKYSVTYLLKKTVGDICWSFNDANSDGVIDVTEANRNSVKLVYSITFRTINPYKAEVLENLPTYNGSEFDILQYAWDKAFGEGGYDNIITNEYKDFVEITGATGTNAGKYTVYLKIKDEYFNTIRWYVDEDHPQGQPGTFKIEWEILPIIIDAPVVDDKVKIVYDGDPHHVFEVLKGYNGGNYAEDSSIGKLSQTNIDGSTQTNANTKPDGKPIDTTKPFYTTTFTLPSSNYAWRISTTEGVKIEKTNPDQIVNWYIYQKELDFSKIDWGYVDDDGKEYKADVVDGKVQFQYTIEDGQVKSHELVLIGLPEELDGLSTYFTDGTSGSTRSEISGATPYNTIVYLFGQDLENDTNYCKINAREEFENAYKVTNDGSYEVNWVITERKFNIPKNCEVPFDGTVREILDLFLNADESKIFGSDWDNYLNVTIEYKPLDADDSEYVNYYDMASVDGKLGYSMFNVFYLGNYRIKFSIKSGLNATKNCVVWMNGSEKEVVDQQAVVTITPLELVIDGWVPDPDNDQSYVIDSEEYDALSGAAKEVFAYIIKDLATGEIVEAKDIAGRGAGIYYSIEFVIADGNDYATELGIKIICADGVDNPFEFCTDNYSDDQQGDPKYWLPKIEYSPTITLTFNGDVRVYKIDNWDAYEIPASFLAAYTDVDLTGKTHFIELAGVFGDHPEAVTFDATTGQIKVSKAGDFTLNFRFIPGLNLSWYEAPYTFEYPNLKDSGGTTVTSPLLDTLIDKKAQSININIEKAGLIPITPAQLAYFATIIKDVEYTGYEINLKTREDTKGIFETLSESYGALIDFEGYKATAAGEYKLIIKLKDPDSSFWKLGITEEVVVNDPSFADYDASYQLIRINGKIEYVKSDGKGGYIKYNDGNYNIDTTSALVMEKQVSYIEIGDLLDEDGRPETASGAKYVVDANGIAIRYSLVDGVYVEDANGNYIAKYKLMADGTIIEFPVLGEDGYAIFIPEKVLVKVTRDVVSTDSYEIDWRITATKLATPTVNDKITLTYNGKEQSAESVLKGFNSTYMEIVEGGVGKNAGTYKAKIRIRATDTDHEWADPEEEIDGVKYVYVTWKIEKADVDLSNARWIFTDGVNVYENGEGMVYTRKDGNAVIYWAELVNIPEALVGSIRYSTNGKVGAYAGTDAGKYKTSFEIVDSDSNFNTITKPDTLAEEVTWNIQRRMLEIPSALNSLRFIFDDEPHDLLKMLGVQSDWTEYYTIDVMYAKNFVVYTSYSGLDGNKYMSYGAGGYKFIFDIISGINKNKDNPNVVWLKSNGEIEVPIVELNEMSEPEQQAAPVKAKAKAPVTLTIEEEVKEEVCEVIETVCVERVETVETHTVNHAPTAVEVVCDELKKLSYGAELQLKSRKYLR